MSAAAASSPRAFRGLYDEHHAFVWAVLRKLGVPEHDAEDVMQEVFLVVHRRLDAFEGRSAWTTWLYGITTRVYWNYARRQRTRPQASASASSLRLVDPAADPERLTEQREASTMLEALLGSLDPDKRTAYVLHAIEGLSAPQISAVTGVKTRTIYSRLRAAKSEIEASARRVQARARNDDAVRRLAGASTSTPPTKLRRRGWAALAMSIPELSGPAGAAATTTALPVPAWLGALGGLAVVVGAFVAWDPSAAPQARQPTSVASALPGPPAAASTMPAVPTAAVSPQTPRLAAEPAATPPGRTASTRTSAVPRPVNPDPPASSTPPALGLLPRARMELKAGRAQGALALLRAHALAEPDSPLAAERTSTMVLALCAVGDVARAKALAEENSLALPVSCVAAVQ